MNTNTALPQKHCLMQHIAGLSELRALHVVHLRNDDTCVWVMRETKRFLIDNVSHYPDLKLEWIAIDEDDRVDQLVRVSPSKKKGLTGGDNSDSDSDREGSSSSSKKKKKDAKGKGKQKASPPPAGGLGLFGGAGSSAVEDLDIPALIAAELGEEGSSSGSEEESDSEGEEDVGQKIKTVEGIFFYEVDDVEIFRKEIVAGRI